MTANAEIGGVLQLAADVIGNLGSLDEEDLPGGVEAGLAAMKEGLKSRLEAAEASGVEDKSARVLEGVQADDARCGCVFRFFFHALPSLRNVPLPPSVSFSFLLPTQHPEGCRRPVFA